VDHRQAANLTFQAVPGGSVTLQVRINGHLVTEQVFNSGNPRALTENFRGSILDSTGNTLTVTKSDGTNRVTVSDFKVDFKTL
jgi:hypothetical protein